MTSSIVNRWRTNKLNPLEVAIAFAVITYGIGVLVVGMELLKPTAIGIAFVSIVVAYTVASLYLTPRVHPSAIKAENRKDAWAQLRAARKSIKETYANESRWWHQIIGALGGALYGVLLTIVLSRLL